MEKKKIEDLRAQAIASMPSTSAVTTTSELPPAAPSRLNVSKPRDGEVSSLKAYEGTSNGTGSSHLKNKTSSTGAPLAKAVSDANVQLQKHTAWSHKYFKGKKRSLKSAINQRPSLYANASTDNLVISFSDDESGSDKEACKTKKSTWDESTAPLPDLSRMEGMQSQFQSVVDRNLVSNSLKPVPKKESSSHTFPRVHCTNVWRPSRSAVDLRRSNSIVMNNARQKQKLADGNMVACNLKQCPTVQGGSELNNRSISDIRRKDENPNLCARQRGSQIRKLEGPALVRGGTTSHKDLADERPMKRAKADKACPEVRSKMTIHSVKGPPGSSNQELENVSTMPSCSNGVNCQETEKENHMGITYPTRNKQWYKSGGHPPISSVDQLAGDTVADILLPQCKTSLSNGQECETSCVQGHGSSADVSQCRELFGTKATSTDFSMKLNQISGLAQKTSPVRETAFQNTEFLKVPTFPSKANVSNSSASKNAKESELNRWVDRPNGGVALGMSTDIRKSCLLNYAEIMPDGDEKNILENGTLQLEHLFKLEELHDKELEDTQEHRRKCEVEERCTLQAYREAQRALIEANDRCSKLHRKRDAFSARFRALMLEASSSIQPSRLQLQQGSANAITNASYDLFSPLGLLSQNEHTNLDILGYIPSTQCPDGDSLDESRQQLNNELNFEANQLCEQGASMPELMNMTDPDNAHSPNNEPNFSTDDDGNFASNNAALAGHSIESDNEEMHKNVNDELYRSPSMEGALDHELLEAALRSKLIAQLGMRTSSEINGKCNGERKPDNCVKGHKHSTFLMNSLQEGKQSDISQESGGNRCQLSAQVHVSSHDNVSISSDSFMHNDASGTFFSKISSSSASMLSVLPSSALNVVTKHALPLLPALHNALPLLPALHNVSTRQAHDKSISMWDEGSKFTSNDGGSIESPRAEVKKLRNPQTSNLAVDPFRPFCLFELRGKCNDEECLFQHVQNRSKNDDCTGQSLASEVGPCAYQYSTQIPTYLIGRCLVKADSDLLCSILAQSSFRYRQRGFCASFPLPFSVQRILPSDTPFLQTGNDNIADNDEWRKEQLHKEKSKQLMQGPPDNEQILVIALEKFHDKLGKSDRKKVLSLLSRSIEADSSSVILWVVYLHIYYWKECCIGKDDMFFHAVQHNEGSYDLWLMYINSRTQLADRWNAYEHALTAFCQRAKTCSEEIKYVSACILDIFLQMTNLFCMCGYVEKVIARIYSILPSTNLEKTADALLSSIHSCFVVSDRCIFWICSVYLAIYKKLPRPITEQFEFEKDFFFEIDWPSVQLIREEKDRALELMKFAAADVGLRIDCGTDEKIGIVSRPVHLLAISHIKCVAALEGLHSSIVLLVKYLTQYPWCLELVLMSARIYETYTGKLILRGFEEVLRDWPKEIHGIQCLWNQYAEYALARGRTDFVKELMNRWFKSFRKFRDMGIKISDGGSCISCGSLEEPVILNSSGLVDDICGFLNLFLYKLLHNDLTGARIAVDKALALSTSDYFCHCLKEHAACAFLSTSVCAENVPSFVCSLLKSYLGDPRSSCMSRKLSRRYYEGIKKPRARELIDRVLGPISKGFSVVNYVLEVYHGRLLVPEKISDPRDFVDYIEALMEISPANYPLALSVFKYCSSRFSCTSTVSKTIMFWAGSILLNSLLCAVPVAPEHVWVEVAGLLKNLELPAISQHFHQQAVLVYPFSIQLWQSYFNLAKMVGNMNVVAEAASGKGLDVKL